MNDWPPESIEIREVRCPYCNERVEISLESDLAGEMVWDCEVCCRPWQLVVRSVGGERKVDVQTLEE